MNMLELALKARLPLIKVETDDVYNVAAVLAEIAGVKPLAALEAGTSAKSNEVYYIISPSQDKSAKWYGMYGKVQSTLIIVNSFHESSLMFDGGVISTPPAMIHRFVDKYYGGDDPDQLVVALSGLSYKDVVEISKLAMAQQGSLTPKGVQDVRRIYFGSMRGLQQVDTDITFYYQNRDLMEWLEVDGKLLVDTQSPPELRPRGLLFTGPPGTGKTMGAKHLAQKLNLPLYILEVGILMSKYVGESEKNLLRCLNQAENSAPCILLIDEVEKLFQQGDDLGVTTRLLSQLLWWLQEHRTKVFVVLTTNDQSGIPPELYRRGRIDKDIFFSELTPYYGEEFIHHLLLRNKHLHDFGNFAATAKEIRGQLYIEKNQRHSHAELTATVMNRIKLEYLKNPT